MLATQKRLFLFVGFVFAVIIASFSFSLFGHQRAYADYTVNAGQKCQNGSNPTPSIGAGGVQIFNCAENTRTGTDQQTNGGTTTDQSDTQDQASDDKGTTCAIEKVGWLLCPIMESAAKISDKMFKVLADNFLRVDTALFKDDSGTKVAWEYARNVANIMFIISFLVIILSQVTGRGLTNYGIKRMLPRLIIAAVAVNASYYICQLAVDLTNIFGYSIQKALGDIANDIGPSVFGSASNYSTAQTGSSTTDGILTVIVLAALATATVIWLIVGPALAVITVVLITVLSIIVILMLRKALIVLLIVLSPIAFVMYLLPNTERLFNRWMKMFGQLLMVFPIIGLLFGAGQLASTIILVSGATTPPADTATCDPDAPENNTQQSNTTTKNTYDGKCDGFIRIEGGQNGEQAKALGANSKGDGVSWTLGLVATGVAIAPLMAAYAVLKGALSAAGAIGGWINTNVAKGRGAASKAAGDLDDRRRKRIQAAAIRPDGSRLGRALNAASAGTYRRRAKREAIDKNLDRELNLAKLDYTSREAQGSEAFRRQLAGGSMLIPGSADQGAMRRAESNAITALDSLQAEEVKAASIRLRNLDNNGLRAISEDDTRDVNDPEVAAAIQHLAERQDFRGLEHALDRFANSRGSLAARVLSQSLSQNAGEMFTGGQIGEIARGAYGGNYMDTVRNNLRNGIITAERAASMGPSMAEEVSDIAAGDQQAMQQLVNSAHAALTDPILNKKIGRQRDQLVNFSQGRNASAGRTPDPNNPNPAGFVAW